MAFDVSLQIASRTVGAGASLIPAAEALLCLLISLRVKRLYRESQVARAGGHGVIRTRIDLHADLIGADRVVYVPRSGESAGNKKINLKKKNT